MTQPLHQDDDARGRPVTVDLQQREARADAKLVLHPKARDLVRELPAREWAAIEALLA